MEARKQVETTLRQWLRSHHGVIGRSEAMRMGATNAVIRTKLSRGEWIRLHQGVYCDTAAPRTHFQDLRAACVVAAGHAVASHRSAAWLWGLQDQPPGTPEVTVTAALQCGRRSTRIIVHRSADLDWSRTVTRQAIPVTDPLRTLLDLGASAPPDALGTAVDRGLGSRLVTVEGLVAELSRVGGCGRPGRGPLRRLLADRGYVGVPHPSILEAKTLALFMRGGLPVPDAEVRAGDDGEYRLDFAYAAIKFAIEVDGYVWHFTPEQLQRDHARRNKLQGEGWIVFVYTWRDIIGEPARVAREIAAGYHRLAAAAADRSLPPS